MILDGVMVRRTRADDAFEKICEFADTNNGVPPTSEELAGLLGVSQKRASYLMMRLEQRGLIEWISSKRYRVPRSEWYPPDDLRMTSRS